MSPSTRGVSEQQDPELSVWKSACFGRFSIAQPGLALLALANGAGAGEPPEQHGLEHLPLAGESLASLSSKPIEAPEEFEGAFLTDLMLSREPFCEPIRFCVTCFLVAKLLLLLLESSEVRRERADRLLEH